MPGALSRARAFYELNTQEKSGAALLPVASDLHYVKTPRNVSTVPSMCATGVKPLEWAAASEVARSDLSADRVLRGRRDALANVDSVGEANFVAGCYGDRARARQRQHRLPMALLRLAARTARLDDDVVVQD
eukprot:917977-Pleurochrysis_carterae.AAC.1